MGTNTYGIDLSTKSIHVDDAKVRTAQNKDSNQDSNQGSNQGSNQDSNQDSNKDLEEICAKAD